MSCDEKDKDTCAVRLEGKQTKLLHNTSRNTANRPLEIVQIDVMEPICPMFYVGKEYILTFVNDFAHFTVACLIESKDQVIHYFQM